MDNFILFFIILILLLILFYFFLLSFSKTTVQIGKKTIEVELADNFFKKSIGLMFRKSLDEDKGMIFFLDNKNTSFWMKNVNFDIELICIKNNKVKDIIEMSYNSSKLYPVLDTTYAIEVNKDFAKNNNIKINSSFIMNR